ncbi:hypothetical protein GCM10028793_02690 [Nocardiopsis oceani]
MEFDGFGRDPVAPGDVAPEQSQGEEGPYRLFQAGDPRGQEQANPPHRAAELLGLGQSRLSHAYARCQAAGAAAAAAPATGPYSTPRALAGDRERQNALRRLYPVVRVVRLTRADLRRPGYILALLAGEGEAPD